MLGGMLKGPAPPPADMASFKDPAPSWTELQALLIEQQTPEERALPDMRAKGRGPPSSMAALRLFDALDGYEPRVMLYRDTAAWCPYCEKVWMYLGTCCGGRQRWKGGGKKGWKGGTRGQERWKSSEVIYQMMAAHI